MKLPRPALIFALLVLAGCNPPPPSQSKVYLSEKCEIVAIKKAGLCKDVSWKCPNGVTTETIEC